MLISVVTVGASQLPKWQSYVDTHAVSRAHHDAGWYAVLAKCFRVAPHYLWAIDERECVRGVLPMYFSRSAFTGPHLATLEGGALADDSEIAAALYEEAERLRDTLGARFLVVRDARRAHRPAVQESHFARTVVNLRGGVEALWSAMPASTRSDMRRARKRGVVAKRDDDALGPFYSMYARRMRDLGTPVESACLFDELRSGLGTRFRLYVARLGERVVAGMVCAAGGGTWTHLYGASDSSTFWYYPNEAVFWGAFTAAVSEGATEFDLGASAPGTGAHRFKAKWSPETRCVPVVVRYYPSLSARGPFGLDAYRASPSIRQRLWSRVPLRIANRIGPLLRRQLPFG
jgi:CelD/BcsL family acetyltransferase involved in cellulose biosynthesis